MEGGGGMDKAICLLMIFDIVLKEGQSDEDNKEWWLSRMCLKVIIMSGRMGGEEDPKVHVVYDVHIVQRYEEKMRRVMCFRLVECEEAIIDEGEEEGSREKEMTNMGCERE